MKIKNSILEWGSRTYVMGVLNITDDSFSGDGLAGSAKVAIAKALQMEKDGADIIDIGGESSKPPGTVYGKGANLISVKEELERVLPVIHELALVLKIPMSIDTYKADVAERAIKEGASLINDVWGLKKDPRIASVAAKQKTPLILMHNQSSYEYTNVTKDVIASLEKSVLQAIDVGVLRENIIVDPGIGFGKKTEHNLEILRNLKKIRSHFHLPLLLGTSRKSFIGETLGGLAPSDRLEGTLATVALGITQGVDIMRVHDVKEAVRTARMSDAVVR
ncbi:MAG: dihydropteroate synthase [bacterium]|nr:dihydropteroate synthase [bacterium]